MPSERTRAYIYRLLLAAGPVAVFYGLVTEQELAVWLTLAAQALGVGLAVANTTTKEG
jgi:hypothetical protein